MYSPANRFLSCTAEIISVGTALVSHVCKMNHWPRAMVPIRFSTGTHLLFARFKKFPFTSHSSLWFFRSLFVISQISEGEFSAPQYLSLVDCQERMMMVAAGSLGFLFVTVLCFHGRGGAVG